MRKHLVLLLVFFMAACTAKAVQKFDQAQTDPREQELRTVIAEAEPVVRNLLASLNAGDYTAYVSDFDNASRALITEEQFMNIQKNNIKKLGFYEEGKYQVHKIEKHTYYYKLYYFVKFPKVLSKEPVILIIQLCKSGETLKVKHVEFKHPLLDE